MSFFLNRTLLIDGDILAYLVACSCEDVIDWENDGQVDAISDASKAIVKVDEMISSWKRLSRSTDTLVCLSDPTRRYFRHDIFSAYKSHRTHGRTPALLDLVKQHLRDAGGLSYPSLEADDVLGIIATAPGQDTQYVIGTLDKDLLQIPGLNFNPKSGRLVYMDSFTSTAFFYQQSLTGDPVDGFPGCPGIGPVKAQKLIKHHTLPSNGSSDTYHPRVDEKALWADIVEAYAARGLSADYALTQARVARILTFNDWDMEEQKVKLWNPPV